MNKEFIIVVGIVIIIFFVLEYRAYKKNNKKVEEDDQIDYENSVEMYSEEEKGNDYFIAKCKSYQHNKRQVIEGLFRTGGIIMRCGVEWEVVSDCHETREVIEGETSFLNKVYDCTFKVRVRYMSSLDGGNTVIQQNDFSGATLIGSRIDIQQTANHCEYNEIEEKLEKIIYYSSPDIKVQEAQKGLAALLEDAKNDNIELENVPKFIDKLKTIASLVAPLASLANSIIGILKNIQ